MLNKKDKLLAAAQKFLEKGSLDKALLEFQRAAQEDAKDTRTWLRIAEIHVKRAESAQATQVYLKTAELYVEQGFFQRAAAVYKNVLKLTPGHTEAHTKLAEVYRQLGLLSDSSQQYEQAAGALVRAGKPKEAMNALGQILEMNPDQVMIRVKIAEVAAQAGLTAEAVEEFGHAAEELEGQGRIDDFLRVAERLLQLQPDNLALGKRAAVRYMERGNPKAALAKLQACFNADAKDGETLQLLANSFAELGQTTKTVTVLRELAKVQEERRQMVERAATLQRIRALDPSGLPPDTAGNFFGESTASGAGPAGFDPDLPRSRSALPAAEPETPAAVPVAVNDRRTRREPTITFSELAVPPILAREPSDKFDLSGGQAALPSLDEEQINAEVARVITETDIFVKYGLVERAAEHIRKVFDLAPEHEDAQERLIAILVQLGRTAEAVEELGILADRRSLSDPTASERHLRRALELDPNAVGARHMLDRLLEHEAAAAGDIQELELNELDEIEDDLDLLPMVDAPETAGGFAVPPQTMALADSALEEVDDDLASEWGSAAGGEGATQIDAGFAAAGLAAAAPAPTRAATPAARAPYHPPSLDELEIEFDLPVAAAPKSSVAPAPAPLDPATLAELEQVDFFLEQGLPDEALAVLDDLGPKHADHPDVRARRERAQGPTLAAGFEEAQPTRLKSTGGDAGAVPRGPLTGDVSRAPVRDPAITPRAVVGSGAESDATTQRDLGIAYKEMGLFDAAIAEFSRLSEDPEYHVFALMMIGECYEAEGAFAEALLHYKKALNRPAVREDEATRLYFLLGRAFEALGDQGEALYFFEKVARRDAGFSDVAARVERLRRSGVAPVDRAGAEAEERRRAGAAGGPRGSR